MASELKAQQHLWAQLLTFYFYLMQSLISKTESNPSTKDAPTKPDAFIFALKLYDGRIAVGSTNNASRDIARINSGYSSQIPKALQVMQLIGIKDVTATRTLPSVVAQLCRDFGEDKVVCV